MSSSLAYEEELRRLQDTGVSSKAVGQSAFTGDGAWGGSVEAIAQVLGSGDLKSWDLFTSTLGAEGMGLALGVEVQLPFIDKIVSEITDWVDEQFSDLIGGKSKKQIAQETHRQSLEYNWRRGQPPAYLTDPTNKNKFFYGDYFFFKRNDGQWIKMDEAFLDENSRPTGGEYPRASGVDWGRIQFNDGTKRGLDYANSAEGTTLVDDAEIFAVTQDIKRAQELGAEPWSGYKTGRHSLYDGLNAAKHFSSPEHTARVAGNATYNFLTGQTTGRASEAAYNPVVDKDGKILWNESVATGDQSYDRSWKVHQVTNRGDGKNYYIGQSSSGEYSYVIDYDDDIVQVSSDDWHEEMKQDSAVFASELAYDNFVKRGIDPTGWSEERQWSEITNIMRDEEVAKQFAEDFGLHSPDVPKQETWDRVTKAMNTNDFWESYLNDPSSIKANGDRHTPDITYGDNNEIDRITSKTGGKIEIGPDVYKPVTEIVPRPVQEILKNLAISQKITTELNRREYPTAPKAVPLPPEYYDKPEPEVSLGGGANYAPRQLEELATPIPLPPEYYDKPEPEVSLGGGVEDAPETKTELPSPEIEATPIPLPPEYSDKPDPEVSLGGGVDDAPTTLTELPSPEVEVTPVTPEPLPPEYYDKPEPKVSLGGGVEDAPEIKTETTPEVEPTPEAPTTPEVKPTPEEPITPEVEPTPEEPITPELDTTDGPELTIYGVPPEGGGGGEGLGLPVGVGYEEDLFGVEYREEAISSPEYASARKGTAYKRRGTVSVI